MIFSRGVVRNQLALETGTINHIFTEILKRRIEPTTEAIGVVSYDADKDFTLKDFHNKFGRWCFCLLGEGLS